MTSPSINISTSTLEPTYTIALPVQTILPDDPIASRLSYLPSTITTLIACLIPMIALMYLFLLSWTYRYAERNPRPLNKSSGVWVQKYAPLAYVFLVVLSLTELAFSSWLILQYRFNHNYPTVEFRTGTGVLLFASSWTTFTAGAYTLLFLHPTWSKHPTSSIGAQAIWIFITWIFWVVGADMVNASASTMMDKTICHTVAYCAQIRGLFAIAVLESLTLTAGMVAMLWLAWQSARYTVGLVSFPMQ